MKEQETNGSDALKTGFWVVVMCALRGWALMIVLGWWHAQVSAAVPAPGYLLCLATTMTVSSIVGASTWRMYMNQEFTRRKEERAAAAAARTTAHTGDVWSRVAGR